MGLLDPRRVHEWAAEDGVKVLGTVHDAFLLKRLGGLKGACRRIRNKCRFCFSERGLILLPNQRDGHIGVDPLKVSEVK